MPRALNPDNVQVSISGLSLLLGAGKLLQDLLEPKREWGGVAVTLPHWIEMAPADPLGFLGEASGFGEIVAYEEEGR